MHLMPAATNRTDPADWLSLYQRSVLFCAQVNVNTKRIELSSYLGYDATPRETADMRPFARALHICPHVICYRGCMLHLLGTSSCVESFVISFLGRQFICFFLVSLHAKALVIMLSSLRVAQKPEHFFSHMICIA